MENRAEAYINASFQHIRLLKETERSIVWLASDPTGQIVVVKKIRATGLPFLQLRDLAHPLYPKILFFAEEKGETWLVEEYVSGRTLQEELDTGKLFSPQEARFIALALLDGMTAFHGIGVVHRDIKPSNIILQGGVHARLIDFEAARHTQAGREEDTERLGTMGYAPPEQYGFGQTDARSDIYALGVTIRAILNEERDAALWKILDKCTELNPRDRYPSAEDVRKALLRRNGRPWWKTAGAAALITGVAAMGLVAQAPQGKTENSSAEAQQELRKEKTETAAKLPEKTEVSTPTHLEPPQPAQPKITSQTAPTAQPEPTLPNLEQRGHLLSARPSQRPERMGEEPEEQTIRELTEGEFSVEVLLDESLDFQRGELVMIPQSEWGSWQPGRHDALSMTFPQGWSIGLRLTNHSGETIHGPTLVYFWVNEEEHRQTLPDLADGAETVVYVPVGGRHRRLYENVPYTVRMSFCSDRPMMTWHKSIQFFPYGSSYQIE